MGKNQHRDRIARLVSWGHWFTFWNIILCLLIGLLYVETALPAETWPAAGYLLISWLGHFAFLPFVIFIVLLFPFCILLPFSRVLRGYAAVIATIGVFALLFDVVFFRSYGFHLNTYSLAQLASDAENLLAGGSFLLLALIIFAFLFIFGSQLVLANISWKRLDSLQKGRYSKPVIAVFIMSFLASHSTHIWADAVLYTPITQQDDLFPLSYPTTAKTLMARHGWITVERYQSQRERLTGDETLAVNYPQAPLLCAREAQPGQTVIIAFDQISPELRIQINQHIPELTEFTGTHLGHRAQESALFSLLYGIPDLYKESLFDQNLKPAYWRVMADYNTPFVMQHSEHYDRSHFPEFLHENLQSSQQLNQQVDGVLVRFVAADDAADVIEEVLALREQRDIRILITGLVNAHVQPLELNVAAPDRVQVPMWTFGIPLANRDLTHLDDIMPTILSFYMSCTDEFSAFTMGRNMLSSERVYPRAQSIRPFIYLFEGHQLTILDQNGELQLYNDRGELVPGGVPATPVFIQALRDLQRFGNQVE